MTKRAFALYNDVGTVALSLIVDLGERDDQWKITEVELEDKIGTLRTMEEVVLVASSFPVAFPNIKFIRGIVYGEMDKAATDVASEENTITGRTMKIHNPPSMIVDFIADVAESVDA